MPEEEFLAAMETVLASDALLYEAAAHDIYSLGAYLYRKKYRFLRLAYVALLAGFLLATLVEGWALFR